MLKALRPLSIIAICAVLFFFGYEFFYAKPLEKEINTTKTTIVTQLVALNNLETARMTLAKNVEWKQWLEDLLPGKNRDNMVQNFLFEDSIQITAYADIIAWFDLKKYNANSVTVNADKTVTITLFSISVHSYIILTVSGI